MKIILAQTLGATIQVEHRTGGPSGPVVAYHVVGGTTQTHSWEIPVEVSVGDSLRMLWGSNPTWVYMGSAYTVTGNEGGVCWTRTSAVGPNGSMGVGVVAYSADSGSGLPSWFVCDASEFGAAFTTGAVLYWGTKLVAIAWRRFFVSAPVE